MISAIFMPQKQAVAIRGLLPPPLDGHIQIDLDTAHALHAALTAALETPMRAGQLLEETGHDPI